MYSMIFNEVNFQLIRNHDARKFAIFQRGQEKVRSTQETSPERIRHYNDSNATGSNAVPESSSMSNNTQQSSSNAVSAGNPSLPIQSSTTMPQVNQLLPENGNEPEYTENRGFPYVLKLKSGEEFVYRGLFKEGLVSTVCSVESQSGIKYAAKLFEQRDPAIPTFYELLALQKIAIVPHTNLLFLHLAGLLIDPHPGFSGEIYITEECGPSIRNVMRRARQATNDTRQPSFCLEDTRKIGYQIGRAMAHLERLKIYHLDIQAGHVLFANPYSNYTLDLSFTPPTIKINDIRVKVIDFGCSKSHEEPGEKKEYRLVQPTPFRSPEVFMGLPYNEKSDVWSMGCLIGQIFTGKFLFYSTSGTTEQEKIQSQFECTFNRLHELLPMKMIEESQRGGHCTLNYDFYTPRRPNKRDHLLYIIRKDEDKHLYELLEFMLRWDPSRRSSFNDVLYYKFFRDVYI